MLPFPYVLIIHSRHANKVYISIFETNETQWIIFAKWFLHIYHIRKFFSNYCFSQNRWVNVKLIVKARKGLRQCKIKIAILNMSNYHEMLKYFCKFTQIKSLSFLCHHCWYISRVERHLYFQTGKKSDGFYKIDYITWLTLFPLRRNQIVHFNYSNNDN